MQKLRNLTLAVVIFFVLLSVYKHRDHWLGQLGDALPGLPTRTVTLHTVSAPEVAYASRQGPVSYAQAVHAAAPAVVSIYTKQITRTLPNPWNNDPFFQRFFGPQDHGMEQHQGLGSGVIVSPDGYILTNNHVVAGADSIVVALADGRETQAQIVGTDPDTDIAVLHIHLSNLPAANLRLDSSIQVGDVVLAIGNPFGIGQTVTQGIVSALGRQGLGINTYEDFIQTDAAINPGNSGGALIDALGNVIGINSAIYSRSGGNMGIGFAIPISLAKDIMTDLIKNGHVVRGWLGIELAVPTASPLEASSPQQPVQINSVLHGGPADQAGLLSGDQIISINQQPLSSIQQAMHTIAAFKPGSHVLFSLRRAHDTIERSAIIGERPAAPQEPQP